MRTLLLLPFLPVLAVTVSAQNLFVADKGSGNIFEFTPAGAKSTFASGLDFPFGLAFNSVGTLFVANSEGNNISEITPGGVQSTFVSGLDQPTGMAFNSAGDLFVAQGGFAAGSIVEITPSGQMSTFASGLVDPWSLAFDSAGNLFVSMWAAKAIKGILLKLHPVEHKARSHRD